MCSNYTDLKLQVMMIGENSCQVLLALPFTAICYKTTSCISGTRLYTVDSLLDIFKLSQLYICIAGQILHPKFCAVQHVYTIFC